MIRVFVVEKLDVVIDRARARAPRDPLDVGVERVREIGLPVISERRLVRACGQRVWPAEQLIVDEHAAVAVAIRTAIAPVGRSVNALSVDVRVADPDEAERWRPWADCAAENERYFVRRPHIDGHVVTGGVGDYTDRRVRYERLRAENAFRLGAPQLVARIAHRQQQKAADDV